jgi:DNA invertase Pin-like site-specific DNA recombinase
MMRHDTCSSSPLSIEAATEAAPTLVSGKIRDWHWQRQAIVYIRQSTMQQVHEHRESTARQYALEQRAVALGWPRDRVTVIDDDQGQSGQSAEGRLGFQRLLAEVSLDHVGIIFGLEMSRLARSNKDWHQLLELCAIFRTLLADQDGIYDPTDYNDRLLLGLKGTMSEAELHILRSRMYQGLLNKAKRGEVFNHAPLGYVKTARGDLAMDADEQVQGVVRLVFDQFDRLGTLQGVLRYLVEHAIRLPIRPHYGEARGELQWHRPNRMTLQNLLRHPVYAGYYRWGHRQIDPRRKVGGRPSTGRTSRSPKDCLVLLEGRCPAYITTERYWANQAKLDANRVAHVRETRYGPSLLGGLLVCGRCGRRFLVQYTNGGTGVRYACLRGVMDYGEPPCQSLSGDRLDTLVGVEVLSALEPAALELHLSAAADVEQERERLHEHWRQRLERAQYETERARRQYQAVEPENRLVARTLEADWEKHLQALQQIEEEYDRFRASQPRVLTMAEQEQIRALAEDIPRLWNAATTTIADRRQIVRLLIDRITLKVQGETERASVTIHWSGGSASEHELTRAVQSYEQMSGYAALWQRVTQMHAQGKSHEEIATCLNTEGYRPPKRAERFTRAIVSTLLAKQGRSGPRPAALSARGMLKNGEWLLSDLARKLSMPSATLHRWRRTGWVRARKLPVPGGHWALWAPPRELQRLTKLRAHQESQGHRPIAGELTTPARSKQKA